MPRRPRQTSTTQALPHGFPIIFIFILVLAITFAATTTTTVRSTTAPPLTTTRWLRHGVTTAFLQKPRRPPPSSGPARRFSSPHPFAVMPNPPPRPLPPPPSLEDVQRVTSYFQDDTRDNSTAFFHAPREFATVPEAVAASLNISLDRALKLHEIGAVYVHRQAKFRRTLNFNLGDFPPVAEKDLFRVYLQPRRFPDCAVDYRPRVVWEDEDLLILDKPPGCPCALHASNALEALDVAASASLGIPLIRLNRLDAVTSGLVTLAKTARGATIFWEELRRNRVGKKYKALVAPGPVPLGVLKHYMPGKIIHRRPAPRAISRQPLDGWKVCQTRVLACTPVSLPPGLAGTAGTSSFHEVEAELITGRTHQLRAVFAAEGSPIVHDTMYAPLASFLLEDEDDPAIQLIYPLCVEPKASEGIALQCAALTFLGKTIEAGDPWWRTAAS